MRCLITVLDESEREASDTNGTMHWDCAKTYLNKSLDMHDAIKWITCNAWFMVIYMCIYYTVRSPCAASYTFLFRIIFSFSPNDFDSWIWPFNVPIHPFFHLLLLLLLLPLAFDRTVGCTWCMWSCVYNVHIISLIGLQWLLAFTITYPSLANYIIIVIEFEPVVCARCAQMHHTEITRGK